MKTENTIKAMRLHERAKVFRGFFSVHLLLFGHLYMHAEIMIKCFPPLSCYTAACCLFYFASVM